MNDFERQYRNILISILLEGNPRNERTGVGTLAVFGKMLKIDLREGFPILTIRKLGIKQPAGELAAFFEGTTSLKRFEELGCYWWRANAAAESWQKNPNCKGPDDIGKMYGAIWRDWNGIDQLQEAVWKLRDNYTDRRIVVSAWDPSLRDFQCLPCCHIFFQLFREKNTEGDFVDLAFYMRSVDTFLGLPADVIVYSLLLSVIANELKCTPRHVIAMLGDTHLYMNHESQAHLILRRDPYPLPKLDLWEGSTINNFHPDHVKLINYNYHEAVKAEMAV